MINADFRLRPMTREDMGAAMKLSMDAGWNQIENDWRRLMENPENVCLAAECNGRMIGTTTAINYANQVAWIGMVLVDKAFRGRGVSKSLLTHIFQKLESCKSVKLDATPEGQQVYKKIDFKDEYRIVRMTNPSWKPLFSGANADAEPESVRLKDLPGIIALDELVFGANRSRLIGSLIKEYPPKAWLLKRGNQVAGFALGREGNRYNQLGPLTASTVTDARTLLSAALKNLAGQPVLVDLPEDKKEISDWLISMGFIQQRHFMRMYKSENPFPGTIDKQFLIAGPEFG
ncbi:MAG: GNAT family N-acetyltransferase [Chitinophagales bacterium]